MAPPCLDGQQPREKAATPPDTSHTPIFRTTTRLVQVSVVVQDKQGNPVTDLRQEDFTILDGGRAEEIAVFTIESTRPGLTQGEVLPPHTYTNRFEARSGVPTSITVILLDALNTRIQDQQYARDQIASFLRQIKPGERIGLYMLGRNHIRILHNFAHDTTRLLRTLTAQKGSVPTELEAAQVEESETGIDELDEFVREANQRMADFYTVNRVRATTSAFEALAAHLARFPGRKNVIWVSASFPLNIGYDREPSRFNLSPSRESFLLQTERAARAISNANVTIYPVDARGLLGAQPGAFSAGAQVSPRKAPTFPVDTSIDAMLLLAERTGGRAFYNRNDIDGAIRKAMDDLRVTYTLGYYPTHGKWDGRFREIKVRVARPGVRIRHRAGYYTMSGTTIGEDERASLMYDTARSPVDATGVGLTVELLPTDVPRRFHLVIRPDLKDITLNLNGDRWVGEIEVMCVRRSAAGEILSSERQTAKLNLRQDSYERIRKEGIVMRSDLELPPDTAELRVVVRDNPGGAIGSVTIPLPSPPPNSVRR
jgi:VWFA-related protein